MLTNYVTNGQKTYYNYYFCLYNGVPYALDFIIGNDNFFVGKHLSSIDLRTFVEEYSDEKADRFIIDHEFDN